MSACPRCADRLKNSGCWYFNKLINNYVHLQAHLSMFSVSVEIFPARMSCSIHCLFVRNLLIGFHKHVEVIFIRPSFLQVCRRNERYWQRLINPVAVSTPITQVTTPRWLSGTYPKLHTLGIEVRPFSIKQVGVLVYFRFTDCIYV